jgi:hypothetical protein
MSRPFCRAVVVATFVGGAVAAAAVPASAATCAGTVNTAVVCASDAVIYSDCVYTGRPTCTPVSVTGPACIYGGTAGGGQFETTWC